MTREETSDHNEGVDNGEQVQDSDGGGGRRCDQAESLCGE